MDSNFNNSNEIQHDPVTGQPIINEPPTGSQPTGQPINQPMNFDPMTGERLTDNEPINYNQPTGQPMNFNPAAGQQFNNQPMNFNPAAGQQFNNQPMNFNPAAGQQFNNQPVNFNPEAGQQFNNQSVNPPQPPIPDDENPACKRLCNISLGLLIAGLLSSGSNIFMDLWGNAAYIIESIGGFLFHAGLVVMIIARVKYPKSTYAKTLMWVYIALYIITVVLIIIAIVACIWIFESCVGDCSSCATMG